MSFWAYCRFNDSNRRLRTRSLLVGICVLLTIYSLWRKVNFTSEARIAKWDMFFYRHENSFPTKYSLTDNPVHHIAFIKVTKAASTTVQNIFLRYGDENNLIFALPRSGRAGGHSLNSTFFFPPPHNRTYDITCTHVKYNREQFRKVMPNDTKYIGIVREPFSHFRSMVRFSQPKKLLDIPGENPVLEYLSREVKRFKSKGRSGTMCNFIALYFGFPEHLLLKKNKDGVQNYLLKLDKELDIVLVMEYLDESIVLMRRILNWDLRHVLYGKLRVNKVKNTRLKFGTNEKNIHRSCAYLNYRVYDFFVDKLKQKIKSQSPDFYDELAYFRKIRIKYNNFCLSSISNDQNNTEVAFRGSAWNKPFVITKKHCEKLYIHDMTYLGILIKKQSLS